MSSILQDLLSDELTENNMRITVERVFDLTIEKDTSRLYKDRTPKEAKSLIGVYSLVKQAIDNYEARARVSAENKIIFTEEEPDAKFDGEVITFSLMRREPGAFGQGAPFESKVRNMKPMLREERDDPENPGYRLATVGYWHDNVIRFTCWAKTNKAANARAEWLEKLMDEYMWFYKASGVDRFMFWERQADIVTTVNDNKWYGRPIDYFVRTETLRVYSEKTIEEILLKVNVVEDET